MKEKCTHGVAQFVGGGEERCEEASGRLVGVMSYEPGFNEKDACYRCIHKIISARMLYVILVFEYDVCISFTQQI